jgi:hypothetical protein
MKRTWFYTLLAALVVAALVLSACGPQETPVPEPTEEPARPLNLPRSRNRNLWKSQPRNRSRNLWRRSKRSSR